MMATIDDRRAAEAAVFKAIELVASTAVEYGGTTQSGMVRDAAIAWRAMVGGQQPGNVVIEKG